MAGIPQIVQWTNPRAFGSSIMIAKLTVPAGGSRHLNAGEWPLPSAVNSLGSALSFVNDSHESENFDSVATGGAGAGAGTGAGVVACQIAIDATMMAMSMTVLPLVLSIAPY